MLLATISITRVEMKDLKVCTQQRCQEPGISNALTVGGNLGSAFQFKTWTESCRDTRCLQLESVSILLSGKPRPSSEERQRCQIWHVRKLAKLVMGNDRNYLVALSFAIIRFRAIHHNWNWIRCVLSSAVGAEEEEEEEVREMNQSADRYEPPLRGTAARRLEAFGLKASDEAIFLFKTFRIENPFNNNVATCPNYHVGELHSWPLIIWSVELHDWIWWILSEWFLCFSLLICVPLINDAGTRRRPKWWTRGKVASTWWDPSTRNHRRSPTLNWRWRRRSPQLISTWAIWWPERWNVVTCSTRAVIGSWPILLFCANTNGTSDDPIIDTSHLSDRFHACYHFL